MQLKTINDVVLVKKLLQQRLKSTIGLEVDFFFKKKNILTNGEFPFFIKRKSCKSF